MQVRVETFKGHGGVEMLRRFRLDGREIEVSDNLDQWHGYDHRYFKVRTADGGVYVLRYDEDRNDWELILFQSAEWQDLAAHPFASHDAKKGIDAA
jgi:hypothetical protein